MSAIYRFDRYELDGDRFELRRDGQPLNVQAKVLDLLFYLVRNRGRLVTKAEILSSVWSGVFVAEASVSHAVMEARKALDDPADDPRAIVTVRGRGYRFVANVVEQLGSGDTNGVKLARIVFPARA